MGRRGRIFCMVLFVTGFAAIGAEMPDRTSGSSLLPVSAKDKDDRSKEELHKPEKDSKLKEELHKLLNGNTVDSTDRRQRGQMNGKHGKDMNHALGDATTNGT